MLLNNEIHCSYISDYLCHINTIHIIHYKLIVYKIYFTMNYTFITYKNGQCATGNPVLVDPVIFFRSGFRFRSGSGQILTGWGVQAYNFGKFDF